MSEKEQYPNGGPNNFQSEKDAKAKAEEEAKARYERYLNNETGPGDFFPDFNVRQGAAPSNDPWAHRSEGMKCKTCMWFVRKERSAWPAYMNVLGRCRRHAPTIGGWPTVFETDWCGDHKLDEGKI